MKGTYSLCIVDSMYEDDDNDFKKYRKTWSKMKEETECNKFWTSLSSLDEKSIEYSMDYARRAAISEMVLGENAINRNNEYCVSNKWLVDVSEELGYKILINYKAHCFTDRIYLLKK